MRGGARERGIVTINVPVVYMGRYEVVNLYHEGSTEVGNNGFDVLI